ncbi:hypothetical protein HK097_007255 [Rhizophlyctis rosea]|uniref:Transcriptional coactivator p15 (PC4) C-terminal domain-containing protein n=1 Tax=Rhizophlyctis rosea TaxID=64517 RepID=A0AAD5X1Q8_9FUNG|nr:hypothetical protein HK097_007255 [Rhizophlyctis rosea]
MSKANKRKTLVRDIANSDDEDDFEPTNDAVGDTETNVEDKPAKKKAKSETAKGNGDDEEFSIDLGGKKRLSVQKFKSMTLVNIREYYVDKKDGVEKPGKKGITLSPEAWNVIKYNLAEIDAAIKKLG